MLVAAATADSHPGLGTMVAGDTSFCKHGSFMFDVRLCIEIWKLEIGLSAEAIFMLITAADIQWVVGAGQFSQCLSNNNNNNLQVCQPMLVFE